MQVTVCVCVILCVSCLSFGVRASVCLCAVILVWIDLREHKDFGCSTQDWRLASGMEVLSARQHRSDAYTVSFDISVSAQWPQHYMQKYNGPLLKTRHYEVAGLVGGITQEVFGQEATASGLNCCASHFVSLCFYFTFICYFTSTQKIILLDLGKDCSLGWKKTACLTVMPSVCIYMPFQVWKVRLVGVVLTMMQSLQRFMRFKLWLGTGIYFWF